MELISVNNVQEAHLIKQTLAMHDIEAQLIDEYIVQTAPYLSNAIGGIKIVVADADFFDAEEVLSVQLGITAPRLKKATGYEENILNVTRTIPILKNFAPIIQILFALLIILFLIAVSVIFYSTTTFKHQK